MKCYLRGFAALGVCFCLALTGCEQKSSVKTEKTVKGPGGTTTVVDEQAIKKSGGDPPPASTTQPVIPNDGK